MANHLTPDELAKELNMDRESVIRICVAEGVPIYQGKIDKHLFQAQLQAVGAATAGADEGTEPPSDVAGSAEYRAHLARVLTRQALEQI